MPVIDLMDTYFKELQQRCGLTEEQLADIRKLFSLSSVDDTIKKHLLTHIQESILEVQKLRAEQASILLSMQEALLQDLKGLEKQAYQAKEEVERSSPDENPEKLLENLS